MAVRIKSQAVKIPVVPSVAVSAVKAHDDDIHEDQDKGFDVFVLVATVFPVLRTALSWES